MFGLGIPELVIILILLSPIIIIYLVVKHTNKDVKNSATVRPSLSETAKAGYCSECKNNVWLTADGYCQFGHEPGSISEVYETKSEG
jgi:hypothetical protein